MAEPIQILCVAGARPNFMKLAPLFREFAKDSRIAATLLHTGQHYDDRMSACFLHDLGLPAPKYNLAVNRGSNVHQIAEIMSRFEPVLMSENPSAVLVVGDVNSTVACALTAKKLGFFLIHVEAGLRSFDRSMPEEINRLVTDAIADLLLVSEESGVRNLANEGIPPEKIRLVGNLLIDSLHYHLPQSKKSEIVSHLGLDGQKFGVVTLHRPANVDHPEQFDEILGALSEISQDTPLVFPVHPRTRGHLNNRNLGQRIQLCDPLGYIDFLSLMSNSAVVLTDSGGIQEETTALGIPCLTLRNNTERPATVEQGTNRLAGTTRANILRAWHEMRTTPRPSAIPKFWDGKSAARCVEAIRATATHKGPV
ncbi:MAG TPA: UDP-N-acetylglucosamine 2-epimerase (non-hydrolyzing) [Bryobacteraceae bacterium]|nr:UDP-N-acetylglucosamine 2-epimerase (non-hydrolyzing) [Bryobacteraceae bacterium]